MHRLKIKIVNYILRHLFSAVTEEDVLIFLGNNKVLFRGKPLNIAQMQELKSSANELKNNIFFEILIKDMEYAANKNMYLKSKNEMDMIFGKAMLYTLDLIKKRSDNVSNLKVDLPQKAESATQ